MEVTGKEKIPVKEGLWETDAAGSYLIGDRCAACGELFFPRKAIQFCPHCHHQELKKVRFSQQGIIINSTVVYQQPAGGFYNGPVPYAYGIVELPEKIRVQTLFTGCDLESIRPGQKARLVIEALFTDEEGRDLMTYKFIPELH